MKPELYAFADGMLKLMTNFLMDTLKLHGVPFGNTLYEDANYITIGMNIGNESAKAHIPRDAVTFGHIGWIVAQLTSELADRVEVQYQRIGEWTPLPVYASGLGAWGTADGPSENSLQKTIDTPTEMDYRSNV